MTAEEKIYVGQLVTNFILRKTKQKDIGEETRLSGPPQDIRFRSIRRNNMSWKDVELRIKSLDKTVSNFNSAYGFKRWPEIKFAYDLEYQKAWLKSKYIKEESRKYPGGGLTEHDVNIILDNVNLELQKPIAKFKSLEYVIKSIPEHVLAPLLEHANLSGQRDFVFRGMEVLQ